MEVNETSQKEMFWVLPSIEVILARAASLRKAAEVVPGMHVMRLLLRDELSLFDCEQRISLNIGNCPTLSNHYLICVHAQTFILILKSTLSISKSMDSMYLVILCCWAV